MLADYTKGLNLEASYLPSIEWFGGGSNQADNYKNGSKGGAKKMAFYFSEYFSVLN